MILGIASFSWAVFLSAVVLASDSFGTVPGVGKPGMGDGSSSMRKQVGDSVLLYCLSYPCGICSRCGKAGLGDSSSRGSGRKIVIVTSSVVCFTFVVRSVT